MKKSKATEAYRVASEIVAIRAALKERGYHIHKQPKQAAWKITPLSPPFLRQGCFIPEKTYTVKG